MHRTLRPDPLIRARLPFSRHPLLGWVWVLLCLAALSLRAQVHLTPLYEIYSPPSHDYMTSLVVTSTGAPGGSRLVMLTTGAVWESAAAGFRPTSFSKIFDPTTQGVRMYEVSLVAYRPGPDVYELTGGLFDARIYTYARHGASITAQVAPFYLPAGSSTPELFPSLPNGIVARDTTPIKGGNPSATTDLFVSHGALGSLYRFTAGVTGNQTGVAFGDTGAGQVSAGVGALAMGPDGRLNVLDTGRQEILRFDADTLDYIDAFSLANTTTDNTSFAISSTGYIFTANLDGLTGTIYDYVTGGYVGTFSSEPTDIAGSNGGKLAMTADADGYVYMVNDSASHYVHVFDTSAIPEPGTSAMFAGIVALAFTVLRRPERGAR